MTMLYRFLTCLTFCLSLTPAQAFETTAKGAVVYDQTSRTVLMSKNGNTPLPPASMSKLMTLNMLFEALRDGRVNMDTKFSVSAKASAMGGSRMFLRDGEQVRVEDLIRGIIVQSGNDACVVVAENLGGSEAEFSRLMTTRAKKLGMEHSNFTNSTGWPDPDHKMSPRDLVFLANRLIKEFPEYYGYFAEKEFTWAKITQANRNPLLKMNIGADGLKTGHTSAAGYGLVGSAVQENRRIIFMVTGLQSEKARSDEAVRIANWAFRQFAQKTLFKANEPVTTAEVWMGDVNEVPLTSAEDIIALIPYEDQDQVEISVNYEGPLPAPIKAGDEIATLSVSLPDMEPAHFPLIAAQDVARGGIFKRLQTSVIVLARGLFSDDPASSN